ncbi:MAG: hypothetical protein ABSD20_17150 [Terriglobales bacterium]
MTDFPDEMGEFLIKQIAREPIEEMVVFFSYANSGLLHGARKHWNCCAACQSQFSVAERLMSEIQDGLKGHVRSRIEQFYQEFKANKQTYPEADSILVFLIESAVQIDYELSRIYSQQTEFTALGDSDPRKPLSPDAEYDFDEFFFHVKQAILSYHSGVGDVIHSVIMKNNGIETILTFDEKDDFKQIPGLTVLHPKDVKL